MKLLKCAIFENKDRSAAFRNLTYCEGMIVITRRTGDIVKSVQR